MVRSTRCKRARDSTWSPAGFPGISGRFSTVSGTVTVSLFQTGRGDLRMIEKSGRGIRLAIRRGTGQGTGGVPSADSMEWREVIPNFAKILPKWCSTVRELRNIREAISAFV